MAGNIKGITIEFQADASKLDKSLREVDKNTKAIDQNLKKVNNALKFNPTSVDLWRQKQTLLTQKIAETENKLKILKQQQAQLDAKGVDKNSAEYQKLQREIVETESKVRTFKGQLQSIGNVNLRVASEQLKQIGSKATAAGMAMSGISRAAGLVTGAIGALAVKSGLLADDLNTLSKQYHIGTKELQLYSAAADLVDVDVNTIAKSHVKLTKSMSSALSGSKKQVAAFDELGVSYKTTDGELRNGDEVWRDVIKALGEVENETKRDALAMDLFGKSASDLNPLIADSGQTYETVAKTMKKYGMDFLDQDTLDRANEFNDKLDTMKAIGALAFQTIGAKIAEFLAPVLDKVVGGVGQFAKWLANLSPTVLAVVTGISGLVALLAPALLLFGALSSAAGALVGALAGISAPVIAIGAAIAALVAAFVSAYTSSAPFREAMNELFVTLSQAFLPVAKAAVEFIKQLFNTIKDTAQAVATQLTPVIIELTPILQKVATFMATVLKKAFEVIGEVIKVLGAAVKALATIFSGTFLAIITIVRNAYNKIKSIAGSIKNALNFSGIASKVRGAFNAVKSAITGPLQSAKNVISNIVNAIKGLFHFKVPTPHIPVPHFGISPRGWKVGDLLKGSIPSLSIKWYAKGGIFDNPTIAGIGEAGPEAVVPLDTLWKKLDNIASAASQNGGPTIVINAPAGMDVNELAAKVEQRLVRLEKQRAKAWGY